MGIDLEEVGSQRPEANSKPTQRGPSSGIEYRRAKEAILALFNANPGRNYTNLEVYREAAIASQKLGAAILSRLQKAEKVDRLARGLYTAKAIKDPSEAPPPLMLHGIHLVLAKGARSPPLLAILPTPANTIPTPGAKATARLLAGPSREVLLQATEGSLELRVACTDNPLPMEALGWFLLGLDTALGFGFETEPWTLARIEVNRDTEGWAIDGASCVTLTGPGGLALKAYNRPGPTLREEVLIHGVGLQEALEALQGTAAGVEMKRGLLALREIARERRLDRVAHEQLLLEVHDLREESEATRRVLASVVPTLTNAPFIPANTPANAPDTASARNHRQEEAEATLEKQTPALANALARARGGPMKTGGTQDDA